MRVTYRIFGLQTNVLLIHMLKDSNDLFSEATFDIMIGRPDSEMS